MEFARVMVDFVLCRYCSDLVLFLMSPGLVCGIFRGDEDAIPSACSLRPSISSPFSRRYIFILIFHVARESRNFFDSSVSFVGLSALDMRCRVSILVR